MAVISDFNSLTDGNLNGQDSWSGSTTYQVQSTTVYEGAKAVSNASGTNDVEIAKSIGPYTNGIVGFAFRIQFTGIYAASVDLRYSGTIICGIDFYYQSGPGAINFQVKGVGATVLQSSLSIGTWYYGEIELDQTNSRVRGRLNGGSWTSWVTKSFTSINEVRLGKASNGNTSNAYYDYITYTPPTSIKSINGLAKASVKSKNGLAIASVKSINGLT
jgi:hypothetical protein